MARAADPYPGPGRSQVRSRFAGGGRRDCGVVVAGGLVDTVLQQALLTPAAVANQSDDCPAQLLPYLIIVELGNCNEEVLISMYSYQAKAVIVTTYAQ